MAREKITDGLEEQNGMKVTLVYTYIEKEDKVIKQTSKTETPFPPLPENLPFPPTAIKVPFPATVPSNFKASPRCKR